MKLRGCKACPVDFERGVYNLRGEYDCPGCFGDLPGGPYGIVCTGCCHCQKKAMEYETIDRLYNEWLDEDARSQQ